MDSNTSHKMADKSHPGAASFIAQDFYIDDRKTSVASQEEAIQLTEAKKNEGTQ